MGDEAKLVRDVLSAERLAPYVAACGGDIEMAMRLYAWNIEVSAAFHGPLGCLEVALRNALHRQLTVLFGRADWWADPRMGLHWVTERRIEEATLEILRHRKEPTAGRMVAELSFGFWVSLLGSGNNYETRLWRPALCRGFPGYRGPRKPLHHDLDHVRSLRNRIAHHEPIYRRHLAADYASILRLIGYISPETAEWVRRLDRVPEVLARRDEVCAGRASACF